jgi:hypothetical protein
VGIYTKELLHWWKVNNPAFPNWAEAFTAARPPAGDILQGAIMLRYNKRKPV